MPVVTASSYVFLVDEARRGSLSHLCRSPLFSVSTTVLRRPPIRITLLPSRPPSSHQGYPPSSHHSCHPPPPIRATLYPSSHHGCHSLPTIRATLPFSHQRQPPLFPSGPPSSHHSCHPPPPIRATLLPSFLPSPPSISATPPPLPIRTTLPHFSIFAIPCHRPRFAHSRPFPSQSSHHYHHVIKCHKRTHPPQPPAHQPKLN